jgi:hypothetical protein
VNIFARVGLCQQPTETGVDFNISSQLQYGQDFNNGVINVLLK